MRNAKRSEPAIKMAATRREAISAACKAVWLTSSVVAVRNFLRLLNRRYLPKRKYRKRGVATFLDDPAQYAYIKNLWGTGRVIAIRGDLTAAKTMQGIAQATRDAGMIVRTVYMSNAPQYFNFDDQFRANIGALPFDEKSVFLHTLTRGAFGYADGYYHYNVQPGLNFQAWLETSRFRKLTQILRHRTPVKGVKGVSVMEKTPADLPEKIRVRVLKKSLLKPAPTRK